jgi:nucleotide-binding universal stress UspA family protein
MATIQQVARISLKNILFPTDFSHESEAALPFALALARIYGSTLHVAHVLPAEPLQQVVSDRVPEWDDFPREEAHRQLARFTSVPSIGDVPCKSLLGTGDLVDVIPAMIREYAVDLVVVGTHGRRGMSKMVMGSGAEKIYRSSPCPVLTVGPRVKPGEWKLRTILCPVDIAGDPEPALLYALSLAEENRAEFIVLQAVPMVPWQRRAAVEAETCQHLKTLLPDAADDWCTRQLLVRWEHPAEAIVRAAADREADLVVMGVRKARAAGLSSHLPWPVASEVVSRATCPVLTVRV